MSINSKKEINLQVILKELSNKILSYLLKIRSLYLQMDAIFRESQKIKVDISTIILDLNMKEDGKIKCLQIMGNKKITKVFMKVSI